MPEDVEARADGPDLGEEGGAAEGVVEVPGGRGVGDEDVAGWWDGGAILVPGCFGGCVLEAVREVVSFFEESASELNEGKGGRTRACRCHRCMVFLVPRRHQAVFRL